MMAPTQSTNSSNGSRANNNGNNTSDNNPDPANTTTTTTKNIPVQKYLTNCKSLYSCIYCRTHLANHDELVSRSFQGNHGRAYLFNSLVNISCGQAVQRELITGPHAVADIHCSNCNKTLGWKYEKAYVETQKYKEGKYIIELAHVVRENRHLEFDKGELFLERNRNKSSCHYQRHRYSSKHWQGSSSSDQNNRRSLQCGANNNNNDNSNHRSSLPPSLAGHSNEEARGVTSSSSSSNRYNYDYNNDDDDDEELMFPFYDDLCSDRSSYPNSLASSQHNRLRRSLYLDSTPYDWKYATSAYSSSADENSNTEASASGSSSSGYTSGPEFNQSAGSQKLKPELKTSTTITPSASSSPDDSGLSDLSLPSASSSMLSNESAGQMSYHNNNRNNFNDSDGNKYEASGSNSSSDNSSSSSNSRSRGSSSRNNSEHHEQEAYTNDDMQFKFEAELPVNNNNRNLGSTHELLDKHCDQLISDPKIVGTEQTSHHSNHPPVVNNNNNNNNNSNNNNKNLSEIGHEGSRDEMPSTSSSSSSTATTAGPITPGQNSTDEADSNLGNSISLEDEEFYDCYTDHEVSSMFVESGSTLTLKIVE